MRTSRFIVLAMLVAAPAAAQQGPGAGAPASTTAASVPASSLAVDADSGELTAGVRLNHTGDVGRFFRYDDLRTGPTLERLTYSRERRSWLFTADAWNTGYRDQRYAAEFERFGRLRAGF